jgi:hypothetical protein
MSGFQKAEKKRAKARLAIDGPSGSGKTWTALAEARVLADAEGGRIAVIDSELGSASLYADVYDFDALEIVAPFHPDKYVKALAQAAQAGYPVVVLDSLTHAWAGSGGVLEIVDQAAARFGNNKQRAWSVGTPLWQGLIDAMLQYPGHVIATMRTKTRYVEDTDDRGKVTGYRKVGVDPVAREGIEYEFTICGNLSMQHAFEVTKSRCHLIPPGTVVGEPDGDIARRTLDWLNSGAVDVTERARALMAAAGDRKAEFLEWLKAQGLGKGDLANEENHAKALAEAQRLGTLPPPEPAPAAEPTPAEKSKPARKQAARKQAAPAEPPPKHADPDRGEDPPKEPEPAPAGQTTLGAAL